MLRMFSAGLIKNGISCRASGPIKLPMLKRAIRRLVYCHFVGGRHLDFMVNFSIRHLVNEMSIDEMLVDEMSVDEMSVDKMYVETEICRHLSVDKMMLFLKMIFLKIIFLNRRCL